MAAPQAWKGKRGYVGARPMRCVPTWVRSTSARVSGATEQVSGTHEANVGRNEMMGSGPHGRER